MGVAEDGPSNHLHEEASPFFMAAVRAGGFRGHHADPETIGQPEKLAKAIRAELKSFDPLVEIYSTGTLRNQMDEALSQDRTMASVTGGLGVFGVLLTAADSSACCSIRWAAGRASLVCVWRWARALARYSASCLANR